MIRGRDVTNMQQRLVRVFSPSVASLVTAGFPDERFLLRATKHGHVVAANGAQLQVRQLDNAFPGCSTSLEVEAADDALNAAGCTRGNSPSGRALDYTMRKHPKAAQWRVASEYMRIFSRSLYGGVQIGGPLKPDPTPDRFGLDVISSYPFLASGQLPRVRDACIERGLRPGALLVDVIATQRGPYLFSRRADDEAHYREDVSGWYAREEVDYHVSMGRLVVHGVARSVTFTRHDKYLARAVDHLFTHREKYRRGAVERQAVKSALNGLLGKFAAPVSPWRSPRKGEERELSFSRRLPVLRCGRSVLVRDSNMVGLFQRHSNVIWTAITNARARVRLWQKIDELRAAGCRVLWCHTDAIIADAPRGFVPSVGTALGDWRLLDNPLQSNGETAING